MSICRYCGKKTLTECPGIRPPNVPESFKKLKKAATMGRDSDEYKEELKRHTSVVVAHTRWITGQFKCTEEN